MGSTRQRTMQCPIRITPEEGELIKKKMEKAGIRSREAFLRKMAIDGYCIKLDLPEIREMTTLLRRCSNNLNQYARKANQIGSVYKKDIDDLQKRFNELCDVAKEILGKLAKL